VVGGTISAALLTLVVLPVTFYVACLARAALERWRGARTLATAN
jgi:Cu/Ag efflux pump CusA